MGVDINLVMQLIYGKINFLRLTLPFVTFFFTPFMKLFSLPLNNKIFSRYTEKLPFRVGRLRNTIFSLSMNKFKLDCFNTLHCFTLGGIEPTSHKRQVPVTRAEFVLQPFQVGERGKKKQRGKLCPGRGLKPRPSYYKSCT